MCYAAVVNSSDFLPWKFNLVMELHEKLRDHQHVYILSSGEHECVVRTFH